ncbi:MAG: hypothetical protein K0S32_456 [Bacteroidetes bacterium]|nr:hypothetical protein [Bacteroidota bacterium]
MKKIFTLLTLALVPMLNAQQVYCDFEGTKVASLAEWNGTMDSLAVNPAPTSTINPSSVCGKYIRDTAKYDNFKLFPYSTLSDVTSYASTSTSAPKMTMKLFTKAPAGTKIDLQLGVRSTTTYPAGIHSEYTAVTTVQNEWQVITFNFVQMAPGTTITPTSIDKIVVLFKPGANTKDTIYFDDPTGPQLTPIGVKEIHATSGTQLTGNLPNPAKESTEIKFNLASEANVSLKIHDMLGREISTLVNEQLEAGNHSVHFSTAAIPSGVYFYTLKEGNYTKTMKMIVSK